MPEAFMNRRRTYRLRRLYVRVVRAVWRFATAHQEFIMTLFFGLLAAALLALVPVVGPALAVFSLAAGALAGWLCELKRGLGDLGAGS